MQQFYDDDQRWRNEIGARFADFTASPPPYRRRPLLPVFFCAAGLLFLFFLLGFPIKTGDLHQPAAHIASPVPQETFPLEPKDHKNETPSLAVSPPKAPRQNTFEPPLPKAQTHIPQQNTLEPLPCLDAQTLSYLPKNLTINALPEQQAAAATAERKGYWHLGVATYWTHWHLSPNTLRAGQETILDQPGKSARDRLGISAELSYYRPLSERMSVFVGGSYHTFREHFQYSIRSFALANFVSVRQNEGSSVQPTYDYHDQVHQRQVHLFGATLGLSYQIAARQSLGFAMQAQGTPSGVGPFWGSTIFYRLALSRRLTLSPTLNYLWQRTTPRSAPLQARPVRVGLGIGYAF